MGFAVRQASISAYFPDSCVPLSKLRSFPGNSLSSNIKWEKWSWSWWWWWWSQLMSYVLVLYQALLFACIRSSTCIEALWGSNAALTPSMCCHTRMYEFFQSFHYTVILPFSVFLPLTQNYNHRLCIDSNSLLVKEGNSLWKVYSPTGY